MVNFPPVDSVGSRIDKVKAPTNRQVSASSATTSRENRLFFDRRQTGDRRRRGTKQIMDRRLLRDRRRSNIDLIV